MSIAKIISGIICLAIVVIGVKLSFHTVEDELAYWQRGAETQAVITRKEIELTSSSSTARAGGGRSGGGQSKGYWLHYEFEHGGQLYQKRDMMDVGRNWDDVEKGDRIAVLYDAENPDRNRAVISTPVIRYLGILVFIWGMALVLGVVPLKVLLR